MEFSVTHRLDRLVPLYEAIWAERFGRAITVFGAVAVASMTALILWSGGPWLAVAALSASLMAIALISLARESMRQQVERQFAELGLQQMRYRIEDTGFSEASTAGDCTLRWHAFAPPRELAGFLVLPRRPANSGNVIALPLDQLSAEARRAIEDRIGHAAATRVG